ncbi:MAG: radical SAM protein [Candidatus Bathyarchaeota archaeon]
MGDCISVNFGAENCSIAGQNVDNVLKLRMENIAKHVPLQFPFSINIEPTSACNLDCFFCPRTQSSKPSGFMNYDLFTKIIDECATYNMVQMINLHKDGEPLLHPLIVAMVRYIAEKGGSEKFGFTSNGILLTKDMGRRLLSAGLNEINISIDAATDETYRHIKGSNKYSVVVENVKRFLESKPASVNASVSFIRMKENLSEEDAFVELWRKYDVKIALNEYHNWSGSIRDSSRSGGTPASRYACENLFYAIVVNWNGIASICCVDWDSREVVGDVNGQRLVDIWKGEPLRKIRELHLRGRAYEVKTCATCTYKSIENRRYIGGWLMQNRNRVMSY